MDNDQIKEMRDYAWKYFSLHADQRIKTFNFYLILATFAVGGILTTVKDIENRGQLWIASPIAFLLTLVSIVFWKLDNRNKELVRHGEAALKFIENETALPDEGSAPHSLKIFMREKLMTDNAKKTWNSEDHFLSYMTYSDCFNTLFFAFGFGSFLAGIVLIYQSL